MLHSLLTEYLATHKRLTVPRLGTFIVKEPGKVLFSEMLKSDDGVLRSLLCEQGVGEIKAAGEIDRFLFEVRHAVEHGGSYRIEGFGSLCPGPNGTILFVSDPARAADTEPAAADDAAPAPASRPLAGHPTPEPSSDQPDAPAAASASRYDGTPSARMNPDPAVRGLRYGRPQRGTEAYTYVNRPQQRRKSDRFIWIALAAALLALAAIAFGYYHQRLEKQAAEEWLEGIFPDGEQPQGPDTPAND